MKTLSQEARLPPAGLAGLDPEWSTLVTASDAEGHKRTWHVLDSAVPSPRGTILCVHGNPNWSYMWRGIAQQMTDWRVIAVDALNMGYSERIGKQRRFADHVADLNAVTQALDVIGPVVTVAHDWGGPISMGWAQKNLEQVAGIVLMNTGVARPDGVPVPPLISIARSTLRATCETTPTFLHGALRMARPQLPRDVYRSYAAPYGEPALRGGIRDFVEDIPILESHPTHEPLAAVAGGLERLRDKPALLLWGAKDIVFSDAFLGDLAQRLPHAKVHRYADAGHQIIEDTDAIDVIDTWIDETFAEAPGHNNGDADTATNGNDRLRLWSAIESRRGDSANAVIEMDDKDSGGIARSISFDELDSRIHAAAQGLAAAGITKGDRLASLVSPGIDLIVLLYACLRAGVVVVLPDAALGLDGMRRALQSSRPGYVVGDWRGLLLAKALRLPATRLSVNRLPSALARVAGTIDSLDELIERSAAQPLPAEPSPNDTAAVVFTSGSTGPSKGVVYTHGQLEAQRDAVAQAFEVESTDRLVVAFAPFAVLAPAFGIPSVIPNMDVTAPAKLRAQTLGDAANAIDATVAFASPAVLGNIAATASELNADGRRALAAIQSVVTAGAPVSPQLLREASAVFANAGFATPYGMTEVLPVTVASAAEIDTTDADLGVCVGKPLPQVDVAIRSIGAASGTLADSVAVGLSGEVWVRADHSCAGYDRLWAKQHHAFVDGWHRSGDVGHFDGHGRLWIEGRVEHLIHTPNGVVTPIEIELQAESVHGVDQAAAVGIGPVGTQQLALVVAGTNTGSGVVADPALASAVRTAVAVDVAAVLVASELPVDRRHNSKIDRTRIQTWADAVLAGSQRARL